MSLTAAQQAAIATRGNVVVVAGAGTGKTRTLIERCLECLLHETPRTSLDEILIVTFTEAAAAELRQRLRAKLEEQIARSPGDIHWQEQIALFETAFIGTLHSFCFRLVREHFYQLELDPQLTVLAEEEARLLAGETLGGLLQKLYAGRDEFAQAAQALIQTQARGWDEPIRKLVLRLHDYTQTLPDPAAWFGQQLAMLETPEPITWQQWFLDGVVEWRNLWAQRLQQLAANNAIAGQSRNALSQLPIQPNRLQAAAVLAAIVQAEESCPNGKKGSWLDPLAQFFQGARFFLSLSPISETGKAQEWTTADPLAQDWGWVRGQMTILLQLVQRFTQAFAEAKRELGAVDFHDLEQHALRLLWDTKTNQPTRIARAWRNKLRFIFVDEYQDINAAQDKIIETLGREAAQANRFLVGDVKQSIYRFRLANPYIFQSYVDKWSKGEGRAIPLVENFRSREGILDFVNALFSALMHRDLGGVEYGQDAQLRFGAPDARKARRSSVAGAVPSVELHLRIKGDSTNGDADSSDALAEFIELEEAAKEARLVALRLRELKALAYQAWDEPAQKFRPVDWRDMAILLRAPANKSESYAKEFSRLNIPLEVARGGFYRSLEVTDLLSLLQILDNPLQDLPLLAVLHSPLVGLSLNELATLRLSAPKAHFWTTVVKAQSPRSKVESPQSTVHGPQSAAGSPESTADRAAIASEETLSKVRAFLKRFGRWRRVARQVSLSRCLEAVLSETHYTDWLLTQPRGEVRHANVQRLVDLAQEFDQFQRQGLFRFLRFIEAQQLAETEPEVAAASEQNAVRLMSIHQSKGLEFPVVVVADLGKPFNVLELRADLILDEKYGLCPQVKPPHTGSRYPSLPYWLARQRQTRELLGEELRLLYVATTRARDLLILSGAVSRAKFDGFLKEQGSHSTASPAPVSLKRLEAASPASLSQERESTTLSDARSYTDWLCPWFVQQGGLAGEITEQGQNALFGWFIRKEADLAACQGQSCVDDEAVEIPAPIDPETLQTLQQRLAWQYPFAAATRQPAKLSVSALRRRANAEDWSADASSAPSRAHRVRQRRLRGPKRLLCPDSKPDVPAPLLDTKNPNSRIPNSAADIGLANHTFLQLVSLDRVDSLVTLKQESERLQLSGALTDAETQLLDFKGLASFWESELGRRVRAQSQFIQRELAFTARFTANDLAGFFSPGSDLSLDGETFIVRGVADLVVILPQQIWVIDFKTDAVRATELPQKLKQYEPQLKLYARALAAIYHRPVSESWLYFLSLRQALPIE